MGVRRACPARWWLLLGAALVALGGPGCSKKPADPEAEIEALIGEVEAAFEAGDLGKIKETLADAYKDPEGNDKAGLVGLLQLQFLRRPSMHVVSKIERVSVDAGGEEARATVLAAGGAAPIAGIEALADIRADLFRLDITFVRPDDDWRVISVRWKRASAGDFLGDDEE